MKIFTLTENTNSNNPELCAEHGLSFYIETAAKKFIFDCGHTGIAWKNAERMNLDLSQINFVVLSHSHYDHAAGFFSMPSKPKIIYTGENFWLEKFSVTDNDCKYRGAGFTQKDLQSWGVTQKICRDILQIDENIFLIGNFSRTYDFETIPKKFVVGADKVQDNFTDEICLAVRKDNQIILTVGCSHAGILNIVSTVRERLNLPVKVLIGGIHLSDADDNRINKTLAGLKNFGLEKFYLCHCSGEKICKKINSEVLSTGSILEILRR